MLRITGYFPVQCVGWLGVWGSTRRFVIRIAIRVAQAFADDTSLYLRLAANEHALAQQFEHLLVLVSAFTGAG